MKHQAIHELLGNKLLVMEANENHMSVDSFLSKKGINDIQISDDEIKQYAYENNLANTDDPNIIHILFSYKQSMFLDSLKETLAYKYKVAITLPPPEFKESLLKKINPLYEFQGNNNIIYMIFNYSCDNCIRAQKKLIKEKPVILNKYSIKLIYFDYYIHDCVLYADAAAKIGEFKVMHKFLVNNGCEIKKDSIINFAESIGIDTLLIDKGNEIKKHLINRDRLLKIGIDQVPVYIINNQIFKDFDTLIEFLENE